VRLLLVAVGRLKAGPEREMAERYLERAGAAGRGTGFNAVELREIDESRARRPQDRKAEEANAIRAVLGPSTPIIVCDETGRNVSSVDFAAELGRRRDQGIARFGFVIGGPDGIDPSLHAEANLVLAFGAMTWPHQLARIMLAEQIYRAMTILAGHPYHRA
jgi:23S rRNA (pseudouridine1915-N3)-methyltransferase